MPAKHYNWNTPNHYTWDVAIRTYVGVGKMLIPLDELMHSSDGSGLYFYNQAMLFL